ncbi:MAG: sigma 54-interacting transcriptional regulator [Desulfitobacteriaceae bacterium]|nr:sigma 54-interacting transcriptional regulator [Desulfitobacteriaceae bacterium]MDI6913380.1 sigma 54-interacting transcriptional regulator [Desulfitobacteriaceae bacterium]
MEVERYTFYQLGKTIGKSLPCRDIEGLVALLCSLGLGNIQVENRDAGYPVFRVFNPSSGSDLSGETRCFFQAGLIAGGLQALSQLEVEVEETQCTSLGHSCCEFRVFHNAAELAFSHLALPDWDSNQGVRQKALIKALLERQTQRLAVSGATGSNGRSCAVLGARDTCPSVGNGCKQVNSPGNLVKAEASFTLGDIRGVSESIIRLKTLAERAARSDFTVLLQGESGTGKELFAQAIHAMSRRSGKPLVNVNCAAIPDNLLEAEFFGYEEGSFTGARKGGKPGKFEQADGGTLFLDEIGDMPLLLQAKLMRVLQYGEVQKLGSTARLQVNVRLIAATNRDLTRMAEEKLFREDLYYRLNVIRLEIPPLRERSEDIPVLARYILERLNRRYLENCKEITQPAIEKLKQYIWPGNIRELQNIMERLFSLVDSNVIEADDLDTFLPANWATRNGFDNKSLKNSLGEIERELILEAIAAAGGNKTQAAKILGLSRSTFYEKLKQYNMI